MKNIITMVIILSIIFGGSVYAGKYLETSSKEILSKLEELKNEITKIGEEDFIKSKDDLQKIENYVDEIYSNWEGIDERWSIIIFHNELDLIQISLISIRSSLKGKDYREVLREIDKSIFLINHILEKEKINLKNIF